ncbi:TorF family putative porin [Acinetobacter stercoris]|uniref:Porin n=1 Tax=Acinetobacter stercoris TaxID=2126983 RepID=A0A2U3N4P3_9GAMM|nr:TorF family putative porin [Acinetobacter stercoris]SPL72647.1 Bacterial protein of unknown function (Gcw_chp) [Acinetobacter stercoris]
MSCSLFAKENDPTTESSTISGNVGIVSKYIYRGGVENDDPAAQAGLEYIHRSGIKVGYWGSTLDYNPGNEDKNHGFEHDFYIAYTHQLNQDWSYAIQATAYVYHDANKVRSEQGEKRPITSYDVLYNLSYKNLTLAAAVTLADASATNAGDAYFSASYIYPLPMDFNLNTSIGATAYNSDRDDSVVQTEKDFAFNEARIGISKTFTNTGLTASFDYVMGGQDRMGSDFDDHAVFGLNYSF